MASMWYIMVSKMARYGLFSQRPSSDGMQYPHQNIVSELFFVPMKIYILLITKLQKNTIWKSLIIIYAVLT